jgi:hypothetical protein
MATHASSAKRLRNAQGEPTEAFYRAALSALNAAGVPYLVGGAWALNCITGISHRTKDLDLFARRSDCRRVLAVLENDLGCRSELTHPHWLAKAYQNGHVIDVIFSSGNGQSQVDDSWLAASLPGQVLGVPVRLCPIEETIWTKAFIMERERYDGADIAHLLRACAHRIDWNRLLRLFHADWQVLLSHLILFEYIYPGSHGAVPADVIRELMERFVAEHDGADPRLCRGSVLSRTQYAVDLESWGYLDARVYPFGRMTASDAEAWSAAAKEAAPRKSNGRVTRIRCGNGRH